FVKDPVYLKFTYDNTLESSIPLFPRPEIGTTGEERKYDVSGGELIISREDYEKYRGNRVILKHLDDFEIDSEEKEIHYKGEIKKTLSGGENLPKVKQQFSGIPIIHWLYHNDPSHGGSKNFVSFKVHKPDGTIDEGLLEEDALKYIGKVNQFERYGYVNVESREEGFFTHP
ncbi:MAG: hypothetical protein QXU18_11755, partial [Thermoplasmatales archaeon]